jgi:hypothetical protein
LVDASEFARRWVLFEGFKQGTRWKSTRHRVGSAFHGVMAPYRVSILEC